MKKTFFIFFLLSGLLFQAQSQRFTYEYKYRIDSTAKDKTETELMILDMTPKGSKFYSKDYFESDSLMTAAIQKQAKSGNTDFNFSGFKFRGKVRYSVEKAYPAYSVNFFTTLGSDEYLVQDGRTQNWKILPEKEKVENFITQKATCIFAGRKWTAWFTTDLPIQDGPYKFHGLPGLIVKIEDENLTHTFELKGIKKLPDTYDWKSKKDKERYNPLITLNETKYKKAFNDFRADPMKSERQMMAQGVIIEERDDSGKLVDPEKSRREQEKKMKDRIKKENNPIELDLLK
ncbi:GLPGLI family protein [Chryseobacterium herbae]|uniref:GLPGLI family protein n=1 Tax=Chryseobacterium herbae TaxID=2976476 RepID=A0ABT2IZ51_9FLAO|nr:GLPGLI family protein [Chryseobacterium sp. pc1-10]MCT2564129.1 GLPGLI family protein [Chryseobacterium sp. pc1-10]